MVEMAETSAILHNATARVAGAARRNRPRHQHLRRRGHRLGGQRAPARPGRLQDDVRHPLPRADAAARAAGPRAQPQRGGPRNRATPSCSSTGSRRAAPTAPTACMWPSWPACPTRSWPGPVPCSARSRATHRVVPGAPPPPPDPTQLPLFGEAAPHPALEALRALDVVQHDAAGGAESPGGVAGQGGRRTARRGAVRFRAFGLEAPSSRSVDAPIRPDWPSLARPRRATRTGAASSSCPRARRRRSSSRATSPRWRSTPRPRSSIRRRSSTRASGHGHPSALRGHRRHAGPRLHPGRRSRAGIPALDSAARRRRARASGSPRRAATACRSPSSFLQPIYFRHPGAGGTTP